jgi:uncharacterized membrane protein YdjX (TVP38/TMEM64 family)
MRKVLLIVLVLCGCAVAFALFSHAPIASRALACVLWFQHQGRAGTLLYGAVDVVATVLLFPGTPFTLGAGFLYGTAIGSVVISIASTAAATAGFLLARYISGDWLIRRLDRFASLRALDQTIADHGFKMVLLMRLQPVFIPFAYLNMGLGLSRVKLRDFIFGSWLGMLPGTILYVYVGSLLNAAYFTHFSARSLAVHESHSLHRVVLLFGGAAFLAFCLLISRIARTSLRRIQESSVEKRESKVPENTP